MADIELLQCASCGGVYRSIQADGSLYFHACPPRRLVGYKPAPTKEDPDAVAPIFEAIATPRDENVVAHDAQDRPIVKAEGRGAQLVTDPTIIAAFAAVLEDA